MHENLDFYEFWGDYKFMTTTFLHYPSPLCTIIQIPNKLVLCHNDK